MMKTIIVGIDLSEEADLAARQAVDIARHAGGELVLMHCGDTLELPEAGSAIEPDADSISARPRRDGLSSVRERLSGQGPVVSQMVSDEVPDTALCKAARTMAADLVVVGAHHRSGVRGFLLGSVAVHVSKSCATDVLVARRDGAGRGGFRRVLVATDFSPASERALDRALELAARDAQVDVVHYCGLRWTAAEQADPIAEAVRARGEDLIASRRQPRLDISFHALPGVPIPGLLQRLDEDPYDLVALGSQPQRGLHLFARDSTVESAVMHAPCSVLVASQTRAAHAGRLAAPLMVAAAGR